MKFAHPRRRSRRFFAAATLAMAALGGSFARNGWANYGSWINSAGGSWGLASNWSNGVPGSIDTAYFDLGSPSGYTVDITAPSSAGVIQLYTDNVTLNTSPGQELNLAYSMLLGAGSGEEAEMTLAGSGTVAVGNEIDIGSGSGMYGASNPSTLRITGGSLNVTNQIEIDGSNTTVTLSGGTLSVGSINTAESSPANFIWTGGALNITSQSGLAIGTNYASAIGPSITMGPSQTLSVAGPLQLFDSGTLNVAGGTATVQGTLEDGTNGLPYTSTFIPSQGCLAVSGGGQMNAYTGEVGAYGGQGTLSVDGSGSKLTISSGALELGYYNYAAGDGNHAGMGTLSITNGGQISSLGAYIGYAGGTATATIAGGTLSVNGTLYLGSDTASGSPGIATATVSGGSSVTTGAAYIGYSGGIGSMLLSGSGTTWSNTGSLTVGNGGTGTLALSNNATLNNTAMLKVYSGGTLTVSSGASLTTGTLDVSTAGQFTFTGGQITVNNGAFLTPVAGVTIGNGSSPAAVQLNNATLSGGSVTIAENATLAGSGTVTVPVYVNSGGTLAPGTAAANGNLPYASISLADGSQLSMNLNSNTATSDELVSSGLVSLGTSSFAQLSLADLRNSTVPAGTTFILITAAGGLSGHFASLPEGSSVTVGSNAYQISYLAGGGDDVTLTNDPLTPNKLWDGTTHDYHSAHWSATTPSSGDVLGLNSGTVTASLSNGQFVTIGSGSSDGQALSILGGNLILTDASGTQNNGLILSDSRVALLSGQISAAQEQIGTTGNALFTHVGGTNTVSSLSIGNSPGASGIYDLEGGTLSASSVYVGGSAAGAGGSGTLNISGIGAAAVTGTLTIWNGTGSVNLNGGTLSVGSLNLSDNPSAFNWTAGALSVTGSSGLTIGPGGLVTSLILGNSQTLSVTNQLTIGTGGTFATSGALSAGIISQLGGVATFSSGLNVDSAGQTGNYSLTGGSLTIDNAAYVGFNGSGTFSQSGGISTIASTSLYIGYNTGSSGNYLLSSSGSLTVGSSEYVGWSGAGTFNQSGGIAAPASLALAENAGSTGTYLLGTGGTLTSRSSEYVGYSGAGTFNQSGGVNTASLGGLELGVSSSGAGTYVLSNNAALSVSGNEYIGLSGAGTFTQSGGSNSIGSQTRQYSLAIGYSTRSTGNYALSGSGSLVVNGTAYVGGSSFAAGGTGVLGISGAGAAATVTGTVKVYPSGTLSVSSGASLAAGTLDVSTAGQFIFTSGQITINNGGLALPTAGTTFGDGSSLATLQLHNSTISNGSLSIAAGSSLTGSGTLTTVTSIIAGGTLWPSDGVSNGIGLLTSSANLTLNTSGSSHSTLQMEIGAPTTPGATYDQISMTGGTFTLGGATLQLIAESGIVVGQSYVIATAAGGTINYASEFSNLSNGTNFSSPNLAYSVSYSSSAIDVTFSVVPEPGTPLLIASGMLALLLSRRRPTDEAASQPNLTSSRKDS